jgi:hypothetical protein
MLGIEEAHLMRKVIEPSDPGLCKEVEQDFAGDFKAVCPQSNR